MSYHIILHYCCLQSFLFNNYTLHYTDQPAPLLWREEFFDYKLEVMFEPAEARKHVVRASVRREGDIARDRHRDVI